MLKVDILAIGAHPDDIELSASGTLLRHISLGYTAAICDLTMGELGTRGNAEIRLREAADAAAILGVVARENLGMKDGFFDHSRQNILSLVQVIRKYKPALILANAVADRHPDHGRASKLISDACFYSGLIKVETTDDSGDLQEAWRPRAVYHYVQDRNLKADLVVDISDFMEKKIESIMAFRSQFFDPGSQEPETPISTKSFIDFIRAKNRSYARDIGVEYAEAFTVERNIGVKDLFDLI